MSINPVKSQAAPSSGPPFHYETFFAETLDAINSHLDAYLSKVGQEGLMEGSDVADGLWEAMRYGTLDGGKRIRSVLAIEACKACGGAAATILPTACAIELVHAQSLMHDDLPCMDNDTLRRGKPSVHVAFGESTAVLAGDALISLAFGLIAKKTPLTGNLSPITLLEVIGDFSDVTSVQGLVNGQFVDILYEGKPYDREILEYIHTYKTGALFRFALRAGAKLAGAPEEVVHQYTELGQKLGLTFQIVDDLLDIASTSETLGKTAGKDQAQKKATYPAFFGIEASQKQAERLTAEALALLEALPQHHDNTALKALINFVAHRIN